MEVSVRRLLDSLLKYCLGERDLEMTIAHVTDDVICVSTGCPKGATSKGNLRTVLSAEFSLLPEPFEYEITSYEEMSFGEDICNVYADISVKQGNIAGVCSKEVRLTATCLREKGEWKFSMIHMSLPAFEQEELLSILYGRRSVHKIPHGSDAVLMELISKVLPGGILGSYLEKDYPLYIINDRMLGMLGYTYEELTAKTDEKIINLIYEADRARVAEEVNAQIRENGEFEVEYRVIKKDGEIIWMNDMGRVILTADGRRAMVSIMTDITDRKEWEKKLEDEAQMDSLTSLYNRRKAISLIESAFKKENCGVCFICDIDNFKSLNDSEGHIAGDRALIELAEIMKKHSDKGVIAARLGGDEYMMFFPDCSNNDEVVREMGQIQEEFNLFMKREFPEKNITLSVGGAIRSEGEEFKSIYSRADAALYVAKRRKNALKMG